MEEPRVPVSFKFSQDDLDMLREKSEELARLTGRGPNMTHTLRLAIQQLDVKAWAQKFLDESAAQ